MKKCIFCGKTEVEFDKNNCWTEEHIIPEALGNETLKLFNVCKNCNNGLGTYVDNYFVNHMFLKLIRQSLGLKGQSGEVPNAFKEGKDKDGHRIRVDKNYLPTIVPYIEQNDNKVRIVASSKEEAKKMIQKKLSRINVPENEIQKTLDKVDQTESQFSQPEIQYDCTVELNRFYMEALKIAFEYAVYKLGDEYLRDSRAIEIQQYLKSAIDGKRKNECINFHGVCMTPKEISEKLEIAKNLNCHILMMHPDTENRLIAEVILFMEPALSFAVLISEDASKFYDSKCSLTEIVDIKTNSLG
jgi:hypothetical protein